MILLDGPRLTSTIASESVLFLKDVVYYSSDVPALASTIGAHLLRGWKWMFVLTFLEPFLCILW